MAAVIGDYVTAHSYIPTMIATTTIQHQHSREPSHYRSSRSREPHERRSSASPRYTRPCHTTATSSTDHHSSPHGRDRLRERDRDRDRERDRARERDRDRETCRGEDGSAHGSAVVAAAPSGGASRFPSPPNSSSPSTHTTPAQTQHVHGSDMASEARQLPSDQSGIAGVGPAPAPSQVPAHVSAPPPPPLQQQQPSPSSDDFPMTDAGDAGLPKTSSSLEQPQGQTIRVRDLAHIRSLAKADLMTGNGPGILNDPPLQQMKYDISTMPINDIIEMVAALLTKITSTNDLQHDAIQRNVTHQQQANQNSESGNGSQMSPLSTSVLAFHGKNVPSITILSYLSRIHRYCPTTYDVFLSLLVYFDRMTERVNDMVMKNEEAKRQAALHPESLPSQANRGGQGGQANAAGQAYAAQPSDIQDEGENGDSDSVETDSDLADDDDEEDEDDDDDDDENMTGGQQRRRRRSSNRGQAGKVITGSGPPTTATGPATYFVVDSFNIHRLIISGVTCASKFFSDVFYTNSRYAKVGGLPLAELNHLELQFLLLNDFQLFVPVEDLEAYATMLVEFYAREIVTQKSPGDRD